MMADSLKVSKNLDGTYSVEWDPQDLEWQFLNKFTSKEVQIFIQQAMRDQQHDNQLSKGLEYNEQP